MREVVISRGFPVDDHAQRTVADRIGEQSGDRVNPKTRPDRDDRVAVLRARDRSVKDVRVEDFFEQDGGCSGDPTPEFHTFSAQVIVGLP